MNKKYLIIKAITDYYKSEKNQIKNFREYKKLLAAYLYTFSDLGLREISKELKWAAPSTVQRDVECIANLIQSKVRKEMFDDITSLIQKSLSTCTILTPMIVLVWQKGKKKEFNRSVYREEVMTLMHSKSLEGLRKQFKIIEEVFINL